MINFGVSSLASAVSSAFGGSSSTFRFVRVIDVVLDESSPYWDRHGRSQSINGIVFRDISTPMNQSEDATLPFAYCANPNVIQMPLKNEIVIVSSLPSELRTTNPSATKNYWISIVGLWNHPNHNIYPDTAQDGNDAEFGDDFKENDKVAPLQTFPGDVLMSGRHGNTIRLGGTKQTYNTITDESNNGSPFIIVKNKMKDPDDGTSLSTEDINEDGSSLYMVSDHTIPLDEANKKAESWEDPPDLSTVYKGDQVLINGGRLVFNAKEEGAFIYANEYIGLAAKSVHIDGEDMVSLDAKKIYLGGVALRREDEPVILGTTLQDWLTNLTDNLNTLLKSLGKPGPPPAYVAANVATAKALTPAIKTLKSQIKLLTSKKVFTE